MLIELQDLGKSFGEHEVLKHVTASVERGDRIGIIGANGTGKTTLLRVLCGESLPDAGDAAFAAGATCGYLEQTGHLDPEKDVYETMRLAFQPALDAMAELETLQKQLAADLHNTAITDKITACNAVIDAMDAYNMDTQIKKVLNGMGFPADTWKKKARVLSGGEQTRLRLARLLLERPDILILDEPTNHLDLETMDWLETTTKMAQSRRKQLEKLEITEAPQAEAHQLNFRFEYDIEPYDELVIMKGLTIRIGERTLLEALDYVVHRGDKLIIAGPNGTGKSTLLQVLDGKRRPSGGMVRLGTGAKPGIFVQQQARRAGRVIDAIWNQYPRFTELEVRSHLARFGYRGEEVFKDCATLSGGEMARLRFAELALERPNLMFLDEPTNHLDIFMRETLTDALSAYTGTLLLVTHDRYLMQTLGCPILYLEDGKATFYQNFQKLHDRDTSKQPEPAKQEDKPQKAGYGKEQRRRRAEVRTRLKALETEIEELGAHIVELENEINDPEVLRDHLLLRDKCDELDDSRFHQQELYDEWEKLAEEQDRMDAESDS